MLIIGYKVTKYSPVFRTFTLSFNVVGDMKEINYKEMKFNPFNLIGGEWMLVTAGDENSCVVQKTDGLPW